MRILTASDICRAIDALPKNKLYGYVNPNTHGEIKIISVGLPEGPILFKRRKIKGEGDWSKQESISANMLWRITNALNSKIPVNIDRIFAGSYNTRSVLEALLAYTPEIYICKPGRQEIIGNKVEIKPGHKHILWREDELHTLGNIEKLDLNDDYVVSERPSYDMAYDVTPPVRTGMGIDISRRHSQIQVALAEIAYALGMKAWISVQDQSIIHNRRKIIEYEFVINDLNKEKAISNFPSAIAVAKNIDCIYFSDSGIPLFAFEVEHTTGVMSGLDRMLQFKTEADHLNTKYVIVAPDSDRQNVLKKASREQFSDLKPLYFPYTYVEELYSFISRYKGRIKGIKREFLETFMEEIPSK